MDEINLDNGQTVLPDWAKETTMKKMAADMSKLSGTIKSENEKLIKAITSGKGTNKDANNASKATKESTKSQEEQSKEIKKTTKEYSAMRGMSVSLGAAVGGAIGGLVSGIGVLTGAVMALTTDTLFKYTASLNRLTDVGLNQSDEFMKTNFRLRTLGMSLDEATNFTINAAGAMQALGGESVNKLLNQFQNLTNLGADLGLTHQDNIDIFREEISFATRMGNIGRLESTQRQQLVNRTKDLLSTQMKYTGVLGQSLETVRAFTLSLLESSSDFQSRVLLMNEDTRQEMIKGAQEFVSVLRATGGELGGELAAAAVEAASFGAIGFSESAKRFITVLPSLAGDFNNVVGGFNNQMLDGEEAAMMFTERLGQLSEAEKNRIFAIARTGDAQALVLAKGVMQFEKSMEKINKAGENIENYDPVQFQRTANLLGGTFTQLMSSITAVKDLFITAFISGIDYDAFNNSFAALRTSVQSLVETLLGIEKTGDKVNSSLADGLATKLPMAIDTMTVKILNFNERVKEFLKSNEGSSIGDVAEKLIMPVITKITSVLQTEFLIMFSNMMDRILRYLNPLKTLSDEEFEKKLDNRATVMREDAAIRYTSNQASKNSADVYRDSTIDDVVPNTAGKTNFDMIMEGRTNQYGLAQPGFLGDHGGQRFLHTSATRDRESKVVTLGNTELSTIEQEKLTKLMESQNSQLIHRLQMEAGRKADIGHGITAPGGGDFRRSFDEDGSGGRLDDNEMKKYLETLILLTRKQTRTIEEGNM